MTRDPSPLGQTSFETYRSPSPAVVSCRVVSCRVRTIHHAARGTGGSDIGW
jgi:hypothetical protein